MLDFTPKKPSGQARFTLDPAERMRAAAPTSKRRVWHLISLMAVMLVSGWMFYGFLKHLRTAINPTTDQLKHEVVAGPMERPSIEALPPMPSAAAVAAQAESAQELLKGGSAPLWIDQPDAGTMAWVEAQFAHDRAQPPLPQRVTAKDLVLGYVRAGSTVLVSGLLEDSRPAPVEGADHGWQRMVVAIEPHRYVELIAPDSAGGLEVGKEIQAVGRYLGPGALPAADRPAPAAGASAAEPGKPAAEPAPVKLPVIAARVVSSVEAVAAADNPYTMSGAWRLPDDIYQNVDDNLLILETRPYYYLLGQVKLDLTTPGVFDHPADGNRTANDIHKQPADFRGKVFTVHGHVFHAWEDEAVAKDHPFGVDRVVRVIMWSEDWGPYEQQDANGKITVSNKLVLRAFEIAAISHQPLPQPGEVITATGRFLRLRAMEVKPNANRDARSGYQRQSDRANTFLFVTNEFTVVPPEDKYDGTTLSIITLVGAAIFSGMLLILARKEVKREELVFDSVRKLRATRNALDAKKKAAGAKPADAAAPPEADAGGTPAATPPADPPPGPPPA
jgi:hypothetical protein